MPTKELSLSLPLKVLAASAIGVTLALGLCGTAVAFRIEQPLALIALVIFALSFLAAVVAVVWLVVIAIVNALRH